MFGIFNPTESHKAMTKIVEQIEVIEKNQVISAFINWVVDHHTGDDERWEKLTIKEKYQLAGNLAKDFEKHLTDIFNIDKP